MAEPRFKEVVPDVLGRLHVWTHRSGFNNNRLGWRVALPFISKLRVTLDPVLLALLPLFFVTFGWRVFPFFYSGLSQLAYWVMAALTTAGFAFSIFAHEMAPLKVARRLGHYPPGVFFTLFGAAIPVELHQPTGWQSAPWTLSGSFFSLALGAMLLALTFLSDWNARSVVITGSLFQLSVANISLAVFQLLPALPLDGGQLLLQCLSGKDEKKAANLFFVYVLGNAVGIAILVTGAYLILQHNTMIGGWLLILGFVLGKSNVRTYEYLRLRIWTEGTKVRAYMDSEPITVPSSMTLSKFAIDVVQRYPFAFYPVHSEREIQGYVLTRDLYRWPRSQWHETRILDILRPSTKQNTVSPETDCGTALSLMVHGGNSRLLVSEWNRCIGILRYNDFIKEAKDERRPATQYSPLRNTNPL